MRYAIMANNVKTIKVILDNTKRIYNDYIRDSDISNLFEEDDKDIKDKILSIDLNNLPKNDENLEDINAFKKIISDIVDKLKKQS